jgi:putative flippase GtrA
MLTNAESVETVSEGSRSAAARLLARAGWLSQVLRFGVVGFSTLVLDYSLLYALTSVLGINYLVSATIAFVTASICNYFLSVRYVFESGRLEPAAEFSAFMAATLAGVAINSGVMYVLVEFAHTHYLAAKVVTVGVVSVWNFAAKKRAVFLR